MRVKFHCSFWHNWREVFGKNYNWKNFTVIACEFEWGGYKGEYGEVVLGLLGLNVRIEAYDPLSRSVFAADMDQKIAEAKDAMANGRIMPTEMWDAFDDDRKDGGDE